MNLFLNDEYAHAPLDRSRIRSTVSGSAGCRGNRDRAIRGSPATPEGQAEQEEVIRKVREEIPPRAIDPELTSALSAMRAERERQGLSLSDVSHRSGIDRATLSRLETGKASNPTVGTLCALARALNKRLSWSLSDEPSVPGRS